MLTLKVLERVRDVPREEWDALGGVERSPFVEWTWLDCLEEAGCVVPQRGWLPRHFALFRDGRLVAAAPAYLKGNSEGEFVFDWSWADLAQRLGQEYYPKIIFAVPFTPATGPRVLVAPGEDKRDVVRIFAAASRELANEIGASSVHVLFPGDDEAALWEAHGFLRRASFQYHWFRHGDADFAGYLARFNSKQRNQIKREVGQAKKDGVRIETVAPAAITKDLVKTMFRFYATTVDKYYWGRRYLNERFFELVAARFPERLAWVVARDPGGMPIAGAFNVMKGDRLYGRYWGTDVDRPFLHFDVCYYHGVKDCLERGLDVFEPGAGGEHKRARGFVPTMTHSAHWIANQRLRGILAPHLERERARVASVVAGDIADE